MAVIALTRHALVDEEWHELDDVFSLVPCLTRPNSVLRGVGAEPGILRILLNFLADANLDSRSDFTDGLLDVSQSTPEVGRSGRNPQFGESMSFRPLDSSSCDVQRRRRISGLFLGVFHRNALIDTNVELGVDLAAQFSRLLRRDLGDTLIGSDRVRRSESKRNNACSSQASPLVYEVGKGPFPTT